MKHWAPATEWSKSLLDLKKPDVVAAYNRERVRSYWEKWPGCTQKEVARDLDICLRTAAEHLAEVRRDSRRWK